MSDLSFKNIYFNKDSLESNVLKLRQNISKGQGVQLLGHMVDACLVFLETVKLFSRISFSASLPTFVWSLFLF